MLAHRVDIQTDPDGLVTVTVAVDLGPAQAAALAHAVRVVREVRYRVAELDVDDILAMRELTAVTDELDAIAGGPGIAPIALTVARIGALRSALEEFAAGEHAERDGDTDARPVVYTLIDELGDLHGEAVQAALRGHSPASF